MEIKKINKSCTLMKSYTMQYSFKVEKNCVLLVVQLYEDLTLGSKG